MIIYRFKRNVRMLNYQQIVKSLSEAFSEEAWKRLLSEVEHNYLSIAQTQLSSHLPKYSLTSLIRNISLRPHSGWFSSLNDLVILMNDKSKKLNKIVYKSLPVLASKFIQLNLLRLEGLEELLMTLYNQEYASYNAAQKQKSELSKDVAIRRLYEEQLTNKMSEFKVELLQPMSEVTNSNRTLLKKLLFYLIYREAGTLNRQGLNDFYRALFIYCGGNQHDVFQSTNLYLLQKNHPISLFRYPIGEEELEWIILTLYELCTQVKKDKFELLAAINALHRKVSNESLFKMSEVLQSLIHLLEDQYSDLFI